MDSRHGNRPILGAAIATLLALPALCMAATMSSVEQREAIQQAETQYHAAHGRCQKMSGNAEEACEADARAALNAEKARIDRAFRTSDAERERSIESAKADRSAARARCDAMSGEEKTACRERANATEERAAAAAWDESGRARLAADYDAEAARCAALAEPAKARSCLADANARYGK